MQQLCAGQDRASFPDRGAEDREEGAEGDGDEDCGQEMSVTGRMGFAVNAHGTVHGFLQCALEAYSTYMRFDTAQ